MAIAFLYSNDYSIRIIIFQLSVDFLSSLHGISPRVQQQGAMMQGDVKEILRLDVKKRTTVGRLQACITSFISISLIACTKLSF